jgi:SAM-dependent methyltransferase
MRGGEGQLNEHDQSAAACLICGAALPDAPLLRGPDRLLGEPGEFELRVCPSCGSGNTGPPLTLGELASFYRGGYASHGEVRGLLAPMMRALKKAQTAAMLGRPPFSRSLSRPPGRLLDVGCGRGDLAAALLARGWDVAGVEPSDRAAAIAERRGVEVLGATFETTELPPPEYDVVVFRHSLEHMSDPLESLRRAAGALRPGGVVVISLPNFSSWQRSRFADDWFHLDLPRHRVHFTTASLALALQRSGFVVADRLTTTSVLGLPASVQYAIVGRCLAPGGLRLRILAMLCCALFPLTWLLDRVGGEADTLHIVGRRR